MPMMKSKKNNAGFGLIEVMIAAFLIGFGITALASLQATYLKTMNGSNQRNIALSLLQDQLDDLRSKKFIDISSGTREEYSPTQSKEEDEPLFALQWTVTGYSLTGSTFTKTSVIDEMVLKAVDADISWVDQRNQKQTLALSTSIALMDK